MLTTSTGCKIVALLRRHSGSILRMQDGRDAQVAQRKEGPGAAGVPHRTARAGGCAAQGGGRVKTGDASCHSDGTLAWKNWRKVPLKDTDLLSWECFYRFVPIYVDVKLAHKKSTVFSLSIQEELHK
ncbi:hypothetical protein ZWY2020_011448 [Hordeum vulgare]|nr:hypothetical protein ZWY2020_011448 [Hordeum vulgare]